MKKITAFILLLILVCPWTTYANSYEFKIEGPQVSAEGAILMEVNYGRILYEKNSNKRLYPASTTKILTALLAVENGDMNELVTVGDEIGLVDADGSRAMLVKGEKIKLGDLVRGLMLPSGNDAAYTIAVHIARKLNKNEKMDIRPALDYFVELMNKRAKEIGALDSNFANPHGFHDVNHYSTAHDLALIAREVIKYEFFREVVSTSHYEYSSTDGQNVNGVIVHNWDNRNELINREGGFYYQYADGIKTGFTTPAGYCLVSSAKKGELSLIAVVLKEPAEEQWKDSARLLEYGFNNFLVYNVVKKGIPVETFKIENPGKNESKSLSLVSNDEYKSLFSKEELFKIQKEIILNDKILYSVEGNLVHLKRNIKAGEIISTVRYTLNGSTVLESRLFTEKAVYKDNRTIYVIGYEIPTLYIFATAGVIFVCAAGILIFKIRKLVG